MLSALLFCIYTDIVMHVVAGWLISWTYFK